MGGGVGMGGIFSYQKEFQFTTNKPHLAGICDDEDDEYNDGDGRLLPGGFVGW